jgi:DNA-binding SARP family transcriptional activator
MIELHTLGMLELRGPDGVELRSVLRQPKRLGLLAYLAAASPRRFHRRDTLLGLFWPDLDEEHARAALRRALYFLRTQLGTGVVAGRGDEEIAVPEEVLWCDATALEYALNSGENEAAARLYRGTFLEGLYVAGAAPEYQEWLERERSRLRACATAAARKMADAGEAEGRLADAAQWYRRLLDLSPDDEGALRHLLSLLDRGGDRSGALRVYDDFARRMDQEFGLQPGTETQQLVASIRARHASTPPLRVTVIPAANPDIESRIAVLPFSVRGDPRLAYLREGMVDLLATKLDGAGEIRTVDHRAVLRYLKDSEDPAPGGKVASQFEAGSYLEGSIVEAGGRLQAGVSLYRLDGEVLATASATAANEGEIFDLVDELARQLLLARGSTSGTRLTRLAGLTTTSLGALKSYLLGERELRAGRYFAALDAFQSAIDADPSFSLAYYRMAGSAAGCALPDLARELADRGYEYRQRLSVHDQLVFSAQRAWLHGAVDDAESLYNTIIGTYPDDLEAWFHLGDLLFHSNPLRGRSSAQAREPLERVLRLEPSHVGAMVHLVRVAALERRTGEMLDLIERILRASPDGDQALAMRALRAFTTADRAAIQQTSLELQQARAVTVAIAFSDVALYSGDLHGAEGLGLSFIRIARSPELRALCHTLVAHVALAACDEELARNQLALAESLDAVWGLEVRALLSTLPFRAVTERELLDLRRRLEEWNPTEVQPSMFLVFAMHNDLHPALRLYLMGLIDLRLGDVSGAARQAVLLRALGRQGGLAPSLLVELEAGIARAEHRPVEALQLIEQSHPQLWFQLTVASPFFSLASQRYLRAELLREVERFDEAVGWYQSIAERSPYELVYAAPARERVSEIGGLALNR